MKDGKGRRRSRKGRASGESLALSGSASSRRGRGADTDSEGGITLRSKRKATVCLIISVIFLMLSLGAIMLYITAQKNDVSAKQSSCWLQEQKMEKLVTDYVRENGYTSLPAYIEDVPDFKKNYAACPSGGEYTWNPITGRYSCSVHGIYPDGFAAARSDLLNQQVENMSDGEEDEG